VKNLEEISAEITKSRGWFEDYLARLPRNPTQSQQISLLPSITQLSLVYLYIKTGDVASSVRHFKLFHCASLELWWKRLHKLASFTGQEDRFTQSNDMICGPVREAAEAESVDILAFQTIFNEALKKTRVFEAKEAVALEQAFNTRYRMALAKQEIDLSVLTELIEENPDQFVELFSVDKTVTPEQEVQLLEFSQRNLPHYLHQQVLSERKIDQEAEFLKLLKGVLLEDSYQRVIAKRRELHLKQVATESLHKKVEATAAVHKPSKKPRPKMLGAQEVSSLGSFKLQVPCEQSDEFSFLTTVSSVLESTFLLFWKKARATVETSDVSPKPPCESRQLPAKFL
jgi:hypothetical protein